jgi:hypothetical protein
MFAADPEGTQQMFEVMSVEPKRKEIQGSDSEPITYYVYDLED